VTDSDTGNPIASAKIIYKGVTNSKLLYEAVSDSKGKFTMPPKLLTDSSKSYKYSVTVSADNYKGEKSEAEVAFQNGSATNVSYTLKRNYKFVSVTGSVKDESSKTGLSNASVTIQSKFDSKTYKAKTNASGQFSISDVKTDPVDQQAHEYTITVESDYYVAVQGKNKISAGATNNFDVPLSRDLRKQKVRIHVADGVTKEKLNGVEVSVFSDQTNMKKMILKTDAQGVINIPEGVLTDTMLSRAYSYMFEMKYDKYVSKKEKMLIKYNGSQVLEMNLEIKKENLAAPKLVEPGKRVLSLKPEVLIDIPKELRSKLLQVQFTIVDSEEPEKILVKKDIKEFKLKKDRYFSYTLTEEERLLDGVDYDLAVSFSTSDGFTTNVTKQTFEIPSSDSLNPPFPEKEVTADEEFINHQPAWCVINGESMILFASNQGDEEDENPFQIWKVKPGSQSIGKVTESIRGSQAFYPVQGPGSKNLSYISNHIAETYNIFSQPKNGMLVTQMTQYSKGEIGFPSISKDGTQIAFVKISRRKSKVTSSIWMMDSQGRNLTRLCVGTMPKYSPDGKYILYIGNESGNQEVWRIGTDGTGKTMLTRSADDKLSPDWVDNTKIVYVSSKTNNKDIWMKDLNANVERQLTNNLADETMPACSSDGRVAFVSNRKGGDSLNIYYIDISVTLEESTSDRLRRK
jgi:Tol biopolymer transport system component